MNKDDAIVAKMRQVEPTLLGKKLVNYERNGIRRVWVPYYYMTYDYEVIRNVFFNKSKSFNRRGKLAVVYDVNEMHAFHYDLDAEDELPLVRKNIDSIEGSILPDKDIEEIRANAERSVQRQILWKAYKMEGKLKPIKTVKFFREAWELDLKYKDRTFIKYAYLDKYGIHDEKARGLTARLENM